MKTRLLILMVLGLGMARSYASAQAPAAPPAAPVAAPAEPVAAPVAPPAAPVQSADAPPPPAAMPAPLPPIAPYQTPPPRRYRLASPQLHAIEPRRHGDAGAPIAIGVGGSLLWRDDRAQHVLSNDNKTGSVDAFVTYDVWTPFPDAVLAAGASVRSETARGDDDYDLRSHTIQAELMGRYVVTSWLLPHLRVAVGGVTTRFQHHDRASGIDFEDRSGSVAATFGAGFTLHTPSRLFETHRGHLASLSLGLLLEGGYTVAPDAKLSLDPTRGGEVERATFGLGSVQRNAPYLRIMGVLRF